MNVPVPTKNPLANQQVAQVSEEVTSQPSEQNTSASAQNGKRAVIGKWAMVNNASISQIADIHAPDYSLNIIRQRPDTVFKQWLFLKVQLGAVTHEFTGSSIEFLDFTKLN